jgi:hypothetical protein
MARATSGQSGRVAGEEVGAYGSADCASILAAANHHNATTIAIADTGLILRISISCPYE